MPIKKIKKEESDDDESTPEKDRKRGRSAKDHQPIK